MDQKTLDKIEEYVKENPKCEEEDLCAALGLHIFDVINGLKQLKAQGILRSEPFPVVAL